MRLVCRDVVGVLGGWGEEGEQYKWVPSIISIHGHPQHQLHSITSRAGAGAGGLQEEQAPGSLQLGGGSSAGGD